MTAKIAKKPINQKFLRMLHEVRMFHGGSFFKKSTPNRVPAPQVRRRRMTTVASVKNG
jgi:hypothetical protein